MICKRLKCYDGLKVMLDNYDQCIDFQYRAEKFLRELKKKNREEYKVQKSLQCQLQEVFVEMNVLVKT